MLSPIKSLGQNFLQDDNIARKIVDTLRLDRSAAVVEIGPGRGALTKFLRGKAGSLIAIEIDGRAVKILKEAFGDSIELIHADVLDVDLSKLSLDRSRRFHVVGNIPYNITSDILFWLFDNRDAVDDATLMVQLEVARRFVARRRTKDYGILSIFTQFYAEPEFLFKVTRNSFYPKPNVDSAVVKFTFKRELPDCNQALFKNIVRATFGKRRKTLRNGLRYLGFDADQLEGVEFDLQRRPEDLALEEFLTLTRKLEGASAGTAPESSI